MQTLLSTPGRIPARDAVLFAGLLRPAGEIVSEPFLRRVRAFEIVAALLLGMTIVISFLHQQYQSRLVAIQRQISETLPVRSVIYANKDVYKLHQPPWDSRTCRELPYVTSAQAAEDLQTGPVFVVLFLRSRGFAAEDAENARLLSDLHTRFILTPMVLPDDRGLQVYRVNQVRNYPVGRVCRRFYPECVYNEIYGRVQRQSEPMIDMRVLFLNDAVFEDLPGGSRVVARELARGLIRRGHEVTFLVPRRGPGPPDDERCDSMRIVRYPGLGQGLKFVREGQAACARLWDETGPFDLVHTHFAFAALGPLRAVPAHVPRIRSFYGAWDQEGWVENAGAAEGPLDRLRGLTKRWLRRRVEAANLRRSHAVAVLSDQSRGEVLRFGYPRARIALVPGGADAARFVPAAKMAVRRSLGLPEDRRLLLSVRRLAARMGLDRLIAAMPAVVAEHPDVLLLIGGQGPERQRLGQLIESLKLQGHIRLVGFIPDEQLAASYQASDLFVLPTIALEGFGLVTVEALASGTPVIGTPVGATRKS